MEALLSDFNPCRLCPRDCGAERAEDAGTGFCGMGTVPVAARAALHFWEEPCISGARGTGAIFFSGCTLGCAYCQNASISQGRHGRALPSEELAGVMRRWVEEDGAQTLSLITPTHFLPGIMQALSVYRPPVPVVYNCGGYEKPETLRALEGLVDVWLPDFKHVSPRLSSLLAGAPDYARHAVPAIREMCRQSGPPQYNEEGIMTRGTLVRHLVLPGCTGDSVAVLDAVREHLPPGTPVSLMGQYTPQPHCRVTGMDRRVSEREYARVRDYMLALGIPGYAQELSSADSGFTPPFDLTGL
ncbi:MAG TPA: radical SAM protein [Candidatus Limnocylindria bacterium]|nr:radical SAM protein [Candidatus Limnocylindria bacterium]